MKICIGIISYFPDDNKREIRIERAKKVIEDCNKLFNLPIIIVAQNWKGVMIYDDNLHIHRYDKLGITGARKELRKLFLDSEYDYMIMLDDDAKLVGTKDDAREYLRTIENHPGARYGVYKTYLLKLFAISKEMFKEIDYPDGEASNGDFFEDMYLIMALNKKYPDKKFIFTRGGIDENSNSASDPLSTWYHRQFHKKQMGDRTREMIRNL